MGPNSNSFAFTALQTIGANPPIIGLQAFQPIPVPFGRARLWPLGTGPDSTRCRRARTKLRSARKARWSAGTRFSRRLCVVFMLLALPSCKRSAPPSELWLLNDSAAPLVVRRLDDGSSPSVTIAPGQTAKTTEQHGLLQNWSTDRDWFGRAAGTNPDLLFGVFDEYGGPHGRIDIPAVILVSATC
jgi:hypothetical protein